MKKHNQTSSGNHSPKEQNDVLIKKCGKVGKVKTHYNSAPADALKEESLSDNIREGAPYGIIDWFPVEDVKKAVKRLKNGIDDFETNLGEKCAFEGIENAEPHLRMIMLQFKEKIEEIFGDKLI